MTNERVLNANSSKADAAELFDLYGEFLERGIHNVTLRKLKDYVGRIQTGGTYPRWADDRFNAETSDPVSARVLEASVVAGRSDSSNSAESPVVLTEEDEEAGREQQVDLEAWARAEGIWINNTSNSLSERFGEHIAEGGEVVVYYDHKNSAVVKEISLNYYGTPELLLDRIFIHNAIFPDTYLILDGIGRDSDGDFKIICSQPFIEGETPTQEDIDSYVENKLGMRRTKNLYSNEFADEQIVLSDLHDQNVIKGRDGNLYFIDIDGRFNTPRLRLGGVYNIPKWRSYLPHINHY